MVGLAIGSFLNILIHRLPLELERQWMAEAGLDVEPVTGAAILSERPTLNAVYPSAHCPQCQAPVRRRHTIPLFGWLLLRGRCADCASPISVRYPVVELMVAMLFAGCAWRYGPTFQAAAAMLLCAALVALAFIDADTRLLPDVLTLPLLWAGLLSNALCSWFASPADAILGAAGGYGLLWSVAAAFSSMTGKPGMGHGDFKLLAALGAWFGWHAIPYLALTSSFIGIVVGLYLTYRRGDTTAPFGPGLSLAGCAWLFLP